MFLRRETIKDEYENEIPRIVYGEPTEIWLNCSTVTGKAETLYFGNDIQYDRVLSTCDIACPIDEDSVLCIDKEPTYDAHGDLLYDYVVKAVRKSLNSISIAVAKVKVS